MEMTDFTKCRVTLMSSEAITNPQFLTFRVMQTLSRALPAAGSPFDCHSLVSNHLVGFLVYFKVNQKEQVWGDV
jgi:hypothetical protein